MATRPFYVAIHITNGIVAQIEPEKEYHEQYKGKSFIEVLNGFGVNYHVVPGAILAGHDAQTSIMLLELGPVIKITLTNTTSSLA